jgi:hypothetical protein
VNEHRLLCVPSDPRLNTAKCRVGAIVLCLCSVASSVTQYQIIQQPTWRCARGFSPLLRSQIRFQVSLVLFPSLSLRLLVVFSNIKIANIPFPRGFLAPSATKAVAGLVELEGTLGYHVRHNMWWCSTTSRTNYSTQLPRFQSRLNSKLCTRTDEQEDVVLFIVL